MPLQLQRRQRGVYSKLVHGTGGTSVAALKVAQINCVEDWTVPDHYAVCEVHAKRIVFFFSQLFSFYLLYYN